MVDGGCRISDFGCWIWIWDVTNTLNISTFYTLTIYLLPL